MVNCNTVGLTPAAMKGILPPSRKLIGLDLGKKTIGLALSDSLLLTATPLHTIRRTRFTRDVAELSQYVTDNDVGGLVIGLPVEMNGVEGPRCQSVRTFADNLSQQETPLAEFPIAFWDERLSTAAVERMMVDEMDLSRRKRAAAVDKVAAAWILQGFLDALAAGVA